jgi:SAM-dependent methyltransferase
MEFSNFDSREYETLSVQEGYREWVPTYEDTVLDEMDQALLERLTLIPWSSMKRAVDLACGTGRTGLWLKNHGVDQIDGLDITPEMLEVAARKRVYSRLIYSDMRTTTLENGVFDLVSSVLADEHIPDLAPLYSEVARILKPGGFYLDIGYHQYFLLSGIPTHFDRKTGESVAIKSYVHLLSDHFKAASRNGLELVEFDERIVDSAWVARHPRWLKHMNYPISYVLVWQKRNPALV